jgi:nicotinamidase-related amidase
MVKNAKVFGLRSTGVRKFPVVLRVEVKTQTITPVVAHRAVKPAHSRARSTDTNRHTQRARRRRPKERNPVTLTTLDPKPALVVIDLQKGLMAIPTVHPIEEVVDRAARLAGGFRRHRLPVVLVNATGRAPGRTEAERTRNPERSASSDWAELVDELDAQPEDHLVTKLRWGAFHDTSLDAHLRGLGVTQVVLAGVATSIGVESTARSAYEHGYNVLLATDAMTDRDPAAHDNSVQRIFPKLGETATTVEILDLLERTR